MSYSLVDFYVLTYVKNHLNKEIINEDKTRMWLPFSWRYLISKVREKQDISILSRFRKSPRRPKIMSEVV